MKKVALFSVLITLCGFVQAARAADPLMSSLDIGPQSPATICRGNSASFPLTITRTGNGNMEIYLSAPDLPPGATASFSPNPVRFSGSIVSATATISISTTSEAPAGSNAFSIVAIDGASHNSMTNLLSLQTGNCLPEAAITPTGCMCLTFYGAPGQSCVVQATTNLVAPSWSTICTTNIGNNGLLIFTDLDSKNFPMRFYRLVAQ